MILMEEMNKSREKLKLQVWVLGNPCIITLQKYMYIKLDLCDWVCTKEV